MHQEFISQELLLFYVELHFIDFLDSADFARQFVSRVVNISEFTTTNSA